MKNSKIILIACTAVLTACSNTPKTTTDIEAKPADTINLSTRANDNDTETPNPVAAGFLLVPAQSAGKISIGTDAKEAFALFGQPDGGDSAMQKSVAIWYKGHDPKSYAISIYSARDTNAENPPSIIQQVRVTEPGFMTADKVGISSSLEEIKKKYAVSKLDDVESNGIKVDIYDSVKGIAFELDKDRKCMAIIIHKAGEMLKTTYLPLR